MSPTLIRTVAALVLLGHGLGHVLAIFPLLGFPLSASHSSRSTLLDGVAGAGAASAACVVLNMAALVLFVGAGLGVAGWGVPRGAWGRLVVPAASVSILGLALFWNAFPFLFPNKIGVLAVDFWSLASVFWLRWPAGLFDA